MDCRLEAEISYAEGAAEIGVEQTFGTGNPDAFEGMDRHAGGVAEDGMIERKGLAFDLIEACGTMFDESHADGSHAHVWQVFEGFEDVVGVGDIPLEESVVNGDAVIAVDACGGAAGTVQRGQGLGDDLG